MHHEYCFDSQHLPDMRYMFNFQKERYKIFWGKRIAGKSDLSITYVNDVYALPPVKSDRMWGSGGLVDGNGVEIRESWVYGVDNSIFMGGSYPFSLSSVPYLKGEYIYLGFIIPNWGHFLVDFVGRLHHLPKNGKFFFLCNNSSINNFKSLPVHIRKFLILLGLKPEAIIFVNQITKIEKVVIPETGYITGGHISSKYIEIFNRVVNAATPTVTEKFDRIYFSRSHFKKALASECGLEMIENLFRRNGFKIIYPEEEDLDNLIFYLNNCKHFAAISGTLIHDLLFCAQSSPKITIINKSHFVNEMLMDTCRFRNILPQFIDSYAAKYPTSLGHGPFLFVANMNLRKFCKDTSMTMPDNKFISSGYIAQCIAKYENYHRYIEACTPFNAIYDNNPNSNGFFHPKFIEDWRNNYGLLDKKSSFSSILTNKKM